MNTIKALSLVVITALGSIATSSQAFATDKSPHSIGAQISGVAAEYKNSKKDGDGVAQLYLHYNYAINKMFSVEVGLNNATDIEDWDCKDNNKDKFTCSRNDTKIFDLEADELEYSNLVVAVKGQYSLTQRNSLYAKIGAQFYDYDISNDNKNVKSDDGVGLFLAAGWQYQWDNGFALNAGLQSMKMGDLKIGGSTLGMSYQF